VIPFVVFPPVDNYLIEKFFSWVPDRFFFMTQFTENLDQYSLTSLWQNPSRIIAFLPMVYAVWWKKNIYLGIIVHCALIVFNSLGILALFFTLA
jgi:hypothetical protein